ncbi:MAG: NRAMP family divalent metal transporter [Candidatus Dormibacteria bacterium]
MTDCTPEQGTEQASKDPLRRHAQRTDPGRRTMLKGGVAAADGPVEIHNPRDALRVLGPGLVTGASDADPSGIGNYSQAGSQAGYGLLWTTLFTYPLMAAVQEMCGRIALGTGVGLGRVLRLKVPAWVVGLLIGSLLIANVFNVGADLGAVSAGVELLSRGHIRRVWAVAPVGLGILAAVTFLSYERIAQILKWLTVVLFAYVITAVLSHPNVLEVLKATVIPHVELSSAFIGNLVAIFGTTITPYLFFWQASSEVDAQRERGDIHKHDRVGVSVKRLRMARLDILAGTLFAQVVMFAILLTSGTVLHAHGGGDIQSADQAASALAPLAGRAAFVLFAVGIIGTGLLAIPVMAGSAVYAVREFFGFGGTLGLKPRYRPTFYVILAFAMAAAVALNYLGLNPIHALILAAGINGVVAPALLAAITAVAADRRIMKQRVSGPLSLTLCVLATVVMAAAAVGFIVTAVIGA